MGMSDIIHEIHERFVSEATSSPILMSDLANLEHYIAESYSGRSLIELLQNADDAGAKSFYISFPDKDHALVANDGRLFTENDLYSLCRSGSSTKHRKGNTIGFRGIGFKSVVNYAKQVHLVSGELATTFSRTLTEQSLLNIDRVPLIRIPHPFTGNEYINEIGEVFGLGYTTVFVFEMQGSALIDEIQAFDTNCMLFLRNIENITFTGLLKAEYHTIREVCDKNREVIQIAKPYGISSDWMVIHGDSCDLCLAFEDGIAKDTRMGENVVHSFMPTKDIFCLPCKINGDFSTDPSRTKVVMDEDTIQAINKCAELMANEIAEVIRRGEDPIKLVWVMSHMQKSLFSRSVHTLSFNDCFSDALQQLINERLSIGNIVYRPDWMDGKVFDKFSKSCGLTAVTSEMESSIPGINDFFRKMGAKSLSVETALDFAKANELDEDIRICILLQSIEKTKFTVSDDMRDRVSEALLFDTKQGVKCISELDNETINEDFLGRVNSKLTNVEDFIWFAKRFSISQNLPKNQADSDLVKGMDNQKVSTDPSVEPKDKSVIELINQPQLTEKNCSQPVILKPIKKWRSMEENITNYFQNLPGVQIAKDVSSMNLGYDIEVITVDGKKMMVEVKSVSSLSDPFVMTNNEYSLASQDTKNYYIVIACALNEGIQFLIIQDPVNTQELTRRIVRWEWVCHKYTGEEHMVKYS